MSIIAVEIHMSYLTCLVVSHSLVDYTIMIRTDSLVMTKIFISETVDIPG